MSACSKTMQHLRSCPLVLQSSQPAPPTVGWTQLSLVVWLCICSRVGFTHEIQPSVIDLLLLKDGHYQVGIQLNLEAIMAKIGSRHADTDDSANAQSYNRLRRQPPMELTTAFSDFEAEFLKGILIRDAAGHVLTHSVTDLTIAEVGDVELARESTVFLRSVAPVRGEAITWSWDFRYGETIVRAAGEGQNAGFNAFVKAGDRSAPIPVTARVTQRWSQVFANYLSVGFTHIVPLGLDHILFVVGLFLLSPRMRPLLLQVTSFTLAHSITLALGITGALRVSPSIVEPLIAASIVYVCIENLSSDKLRPWRIPAVFAFGLLHGLGFAGVLSEVGLTQGSFVTALVAFNLGVEFGQLAVILVCFAGVGYWFRDRPWYRMRITIPACTAIACAGSFWFVQRVFFTG
ncbi:MAG: hypothetical protein ACI9W2_003837 [Gammaproteobacteria bacterium]|jgi:hypothetical protein